MNEQDQATLDNVARNMRGWIDAGEGPSLAQVRDTLHLLESVTGLSIKTPEDEITAWEDPDA
jgi:hypothetical protein